MLNFSTAKCVDFCTLSTIFKVPLVLWCALIANRAEKANYYFPNQVVNSYKNSFGVVISIIFIDDFSETSSLQYEILLIQVLRYPLCLD